MEIDNDVVVTNKGKVPRTEKFHDQLSDLKQQLGEHMIPPGTQGPISTEELKHNLEMWTIPDNEIDPKLLEIKDDILNFFKAKALSEGIIEDASNFNLKVTFAKSEFFLDEPGTRGIYYPLERVIVIKYSGINDEMDLFTIASTIFHESRHATSKQSGMISLNPNLEPYAPGELAYDNVDIKTGMDRMSLYPESDLLEEIFAEGYTAENIGKINNHDFKQSFARCLQICARQGFDARLITSYKKKETGVPEFKKTNQNYVLRLFYDLQEKIPNLLDLCIEIRAGMPGARNKLAKEIIINYDKDVLALLVRGVKDDAYPMMLIVENQNKK